MQEQEKKWSSLSMYWCYLSQDVYVIYAELSDKKTPKQLSIDEAEVFYVAVIAK